MKIISFRPQNDEAEAFEKGLDILGLKERNGRSELARAAFRAGYAIAIKQLAEKKKKEATAQLKLLERAKGFEPSTLTLAT